MAYQENVDNERYLILSQRLPSGKSKDERIVLHIDTRAWSKFDDFVDTHAAPDHEVLPKEVVSHVVTWEEEPTPIMFTHTKLQCGDAEIICDVRSLGEYFEVVLHGNNLTYLEVFAKYIIRYVREKYVYPAMNWRLLSALPAPGELYHDRDFRSSIWARSKH